MSSRLPENAKNSDFEKGKQMSPIPFVPITEEESDPNSHRVSYKLTTGVKTSLRSWTGQGSNESFVIHIKAVSAAVKGTGKWGELEENEAALQAATAEFVAANDRLETAEADLDEVDPDDADQMTLFAEEVTAARAAKVIAREAVTVRKNAVTANMSGIFAFTSNFFTGDGQPLWQDIVDKQTTSDDWTDVQGREHQGARGMTKGAYLDCIILLLQTRFANDAAEQMKVYATRVRKPGYCSVKAFLQRMEMLFGYVDYLPGRIDSRDVTATCKRVVPYDAEEQASHALQAMPENYRLKYQLMFQTPQNMGELLNNLMKVELSCSGDTKNSSQANVREASQKPIPKKAAKPAAKFKKNKAVRKYCDRCGGHGLENQAHTHRSEDCKRFDSNGKPKKDFKGPSSGYKAAGHAYAQLAKELEEFKKSAKKDRASIKKLKSKSKRKKYADSSDSDSSS